MENWALFQVHCYCVPQAITDLCADLQEPKWFGSLFLNEQAVLLLYQWSLNQDMTSGNWRTEAGPSDRTKRISVNAMKVKGHWVVLPPKGDVGSVNSWSCLQLHKGRRFWAEPVTHYQTLSTLQVFHEFCSWQNISTSSFSLKLLVKVTW